jgi:hypothetical protein
LAEGVPMGLPCRFQCCCVGVLVVSLLVVLGGGVAAQPAATGQPLMVEKNLFSAERKPVDSKTAEPAAEAPKLGKGTVQLDGVFIHGDVRKAILRVNPSLLKKSKNKAEPFVSVGENDQIGDYKVVKIEPRSITLEQRGATFVIPLFAPGKVTPPPAKLPAAPGPSPQPGPAGNPPHPQPAREIPPGPPPPAPGEQVQPPGQVSGMPFPSGAVQLPPGAVQPPPGPGSPMDVPAGAGEMQPPNVEMGEGDEPQ